MAMDGQWEELFFVGGSGDEDECLSLSDLPLTNGNTLHVKKKKKKKKKKKEVSCCNKSSSEDFEFRTIDHGMCAADELFFEGQLLPLRLSSCGSQNRYSISCSLISSSGGSSRSQSSSSRSSSSEAPQPRASVSASSSNIFYAHPSPRPQAAVRTGIATARRSTDRRVFRLGLVMTPEIELNNLRRLRRQQRTSTSTSNDKCATRKQTKKNMSSLSLGFGCMCGPDVVEPMPMPIKSTNSPTKKITKEEEEEPGTCRSRMVEWLEEVSIAKVLVG